ncbi:MAG: hypothetical protein NTX03_01450, partial [Bacteroidetes bacterium]|nr:hypothetical protein [Bacteroidota bacterium]
MYKVSLKLCSIAIISAIVFLVFSCNNPTKKQKEGTTDSTKTITENPAKKIDDLQKEVFTDTAVSPSKKEIKVEITEDGAKMNDIARLIAGLPADTAKSDLDSFRKSPSWKKFANSFISTWYYALSKRLKPMVKWRNTELDEINKSGDDVFYPFSGPDFMNAFTFFPTAKTYTLLALEKPGGLPVMTQYDTSEIGGYLNSVQKSLKDILILSFFKTISMQKDLDKNSVNGSVPLISIFIVRTGNKILNMERVRISGKGEIVKMSEDTAIKVQNPGIRITFKTSKGEVKELYYFS